ncbi:MAG TPA: C13 family peptidase [Hyphomicrobiaceae bacterium]|nr:C13 family peptidase [Hyphomicrobiaceae bacterium]
MAGALATAIAQPRRIEVDVEQAYYRQPELVSRTLAEIDTARADRTQLYFVGFAGYGAEAVFKREVLAVRELFDERFGTKGRSVVLVNHASTVEEIPLANLTNLDRILQHLGGLLDKQRDVLFLFLTSHGTKGVFAVDMPGFGFNNLTPQRLKAMLDGSGIKNRVVVISACRSGSFIPALADANTLVITAAHAERTSFGCEDRRQWTYFGDAFFNHALREEASFTKAFERAKRLIRQWERKERLTPSLPQVAGGAALKASLEAVASAR